MSQTVRTTALRRFLPVLASLLLAVSCLPSEPAPPPDASCPACDTQACLEDSTDTAQDTAQDTADTLPETAAGDDTEVLVPDSQGDTAADATPYCNGDQTCDQDGVCLGTQAVCTMTDGWLCPYADNPDWEPKETLCDQKDNDCDGDIDEDLPVPAGICSRKGICAVALAPVCDQGVWDCGVTGLPGFEAQELTCDELDNDCDGETDEGLCQACQPGEGRCVGAIPQTCGSDGNTWTPGTCAGGKSCMGPGECTSPSSLELTASAGDYIGNPEAARLAGGSWVVGWTGPDSNLTGIVFRLVDASMALSGAALQANLSASEEQARPVFAAGPDGSFVSLWLSYGQFGNAWSLVGRLFGADGQSGFGEAAVSQQKDASAANPSVFYLDGRYVAVWEGGAAEDRDVFVRWLDEKTGMPLGEAQAVGGGVGVQDRAPSAALLDAQHLLVVWQQGGVVSEVRGRILSRAETGSTIAIQKKDGEALIDPKVAVNGSRVALLWNEMGAVRYCVRVYNEKLEPVADAVCLTPAADKLNSVSLAPDGADGFALLLHASDTSPAAVRLVPLSKAGVLGTAKQLANTTASNQVKVKLTGTFQGKALALWEDTVSGKKKLFGMFVNLLQ